MSKIQKIVFQNIPLQNGVVQSKTILSYQLFGQPVGSAPLVVVNHALTGNSQVIGENGWWNELIGIDKTIDTTKYTILAFNVPGNGFDGKIIDNYRDFTARDIAKLFIEGLNYLKVSDVFALIGGSVGGGIAWEMIAIEPKLTQNLIAIATDTKITSLNKELKFIPLSDTAKIAEIIMNYFQINDI